VAPSEKTNFILLQRATQFSAVSVTGLKPTTRRHNVIYFAPVWRYPDAVEQ